jgi:periplasmic divalent cation tolerance protein
VPQRRTRGRPRPKPDAFATLSVYTTVPSRAEARRLAKVAVARRLAACANAFSIDSQYWWQDRIEAADEWAVFFKTTRGNFEDLRRLIRAEHSYDLPCIVAFEHAEVDGSYAHWIRREARGGSAAGRRKRASRPTRRRS